MKNACHTNIFWNILKNFGPQTLQMTTFEKNISKPFSNVTQSFILDMFVETFEKCFENICDTNICDRNVLRTYTFMKHIFMLQTYLKCLCMFRNVLAMF